MAEYIEMQSTAYAMLLIARTRISWYPRDEFSTIALCFALYSRKKLTGTIKVPVW